VKHSLSQTTPSKDFVSIEEIRQQALKTLAKRFGQTRAENYCGSNVGSITGSSFLRNRAALDEMRLRTRLIHRINVVDTSLEVLGVSAKTPVFAAPIAGSAVDYQEVIKGCQEQQTLCFIGYPQPHNTIKAFAQIPEKKIAWIIKPLQDFEELKKCFRIAEEAGCFAVGIDVDSAAGLQQYTHSSTWRLDWSFKSMKELQTIREWTTLPFVIKGILSVEDAELCVAAGVDALIISNHAGHALDCTQSAVDVLPKIVNTVGQKVEVLMDGGIRHGTDILKALALGAKGVLVGRPTIWGYNAGGAAGVAKLFKLLTLELARAMQLTGVSDVKDVPMSILAL
jgi:4-hydroxymandelate oxidase